MSDLLSFLEMFFHGLNLVLFWVLVVFSLVYMFYSFVIYIFRYFLLIPIGLLLRDKYFVVGVDYDFLNPHLWQGKVIDYKEYYLKVCLFDFYSSLSIFNALAVLYASVLTSNIFFPLSFYLISIFCLFKSYIFYNKRAVAKDKLNKYYESLNKVSRRIS